jgi:hypothetical protein
MMRLKAPVPNAVHPEAWHEGQDAAAHFRLGVLMVSVRAIPYAAAETRQEETLLLHRSPVQIPAVQGKLRLGPAIPSGHGRWQVVVTRDVKEGDVQRRHHVIKIVAREIAAPQHQLDVAEPVLDLRAVDLLHHLIAERENLHGKPTAAERPFAATLDTAGTRPLLRGPSCAASARVVW